MKIMHCRWEPHNERLSLDLYVVDRKPHRSEVQPVIDLHEQGVEVAIVSKAFADGHSQTLDQVADLKRRNELLVEDNKALGEENGVLWEENRELRATIEPLTRGLVDEEKIVREAFADFENWSDLAIVPLEVGRYLGERYPKEPTAEEKYAALLSEINASDSVADGVELMKRFIEGLGDE